MSDGRPPADVVLAHAIRGARRQRYMTQADLAKAVTEASGGAVYVSRSTVTRWEATDHTGRRPSLKYLEFLVQVLELPESLTSAAA